MAINYDQAVGFYDETRAYRDGVVERYRDALFAYTGADPSARILELGIGSGLIAKAFLRTASDYYGIDLSVGMMRLVGGKLEGGSCPRLAQADCARLPFAASSFDLLHAVRVFHHLVDWRACIDEARRLLRIGGALVIVENLPPPMAEAPPWTVVQEKWDEILRGLGQGDDDTQHGIWLTDEAMSQYIASTGASAESVELLRYHEKPVSRRMMVERRVAGMFSSDWRLPKSTQRAAAQTLVEWLERECEAPDELVVREMTFRALIARW
jgi:ubiquinone/menaquinone biosynthesis C-methylase UbiE